LDGLADKTARNTANFTTDEIAQEIAEVVQPTSPKSPELSDRPQRWWPAVVKFCH
jgi:hypothetical protein